MVRMSSSDTDLFIFTLFPRVEAMSLSALHCFNNSAFHADSYGFLHCCYHLEVVTPSLFHNPSRAEIPAPFRLFFFKVELKSGGLWPYLCLSATVYAFICSVVAGVSLVILSRLLSVPTQPQHVLSRWSLKARKHSWLYLCQEELEQYYF